MFSTFPFHVCGGGNVWLERDQWSSPTLSMSPQESSLLTTHQKNVLGGSLLQALMKQYDVPHKLFRESGMQRVKVIKTYRTCTPFP